MQKEEVRIMRGLALSMGFTCSLAIEHDKETITMSDKVISLQAEIASPHDTRHDLSTKTPAPLFRVHWFHALY